MSAVERSNGSVERSSALGRLAGLLREQGGLLAALAVTDDAALARLARDGGEESPARLAASGPRAAHAREEYELLVEAIYEGYLLHYGAPRVVAAGEADLRLLAGDRLYALGLARLVVLGDTAAVAELADAIALSSLAQAAGEPLLADAVWAAGARAVGWGSSEAHARAKRLVLNGSAEGLEAIRTSAEGHPTSP